MCGIAGIVSPPGNAADIRSMTESLRHRGPDSGGYFHDGFSADAGASSVALGHRRLAILDLSPAGAQPMQSRCGRYILALNGEIFNYAELRSSLPGPFVSSTDTEALVEACAAWGVESALSRLNGMFAFALWDRQTCELTLARDRSGEKPLVYFWDGATFAFASELKALAALHSSRLDAAAVDVYFALGYIPAPLAIFRNSRKLSAGCLLRFRDGAVEVRRWWFPERANQESTTPLWSRDDPGRQLRTLVRDAARLRLRADVPVALSLSGGIDSSIIACECAAQGASPEAFTVALDGDSADLPFARLAAKHLGLRHRVIEIRGGAVPGQLDFAIGCYDEPFADSSALPLLELARALGRRYKVILTGDGGDEAFGGYPHYCRIRAKQMLKAAAAAAGLCDGAGSPTDVYVQSKALFRRKERARLLRETRPSGDPLAELLRSDDFLAQASGSPLRQALWRDRHLYLPNDLSYKTDIAFGAFGMEARAPFLDHRILEWAQDLDSRRLVRGSRKKILLREAYRGRLPPALLDRPKHGFGSPVDLWLAGPLQKMIRQSLPCPLLDPAAQGGLSGQRLWTALVFARWAQRWSARW